MKWSHKSVRLLIKETNSTDPISVVKERARNLVLSAMDKGWNGPPFNPIELAKIAGVDLIPNDSVVDAQTVPLRKNFLQIQYNPYQKPTRINFSISHEITHTLFSDCQDEIRHREEDPQKNWELEFLCNIGAAEILLPYAIFGNDVSKSEVNLNGLIDLANKYEASLESVFLRYTEVSDKSSAIAVCTFHGDKLVVDYFKSSIAFNGSIPEGYHVPKNSKMNECTTPGWSASDIEKWNCFDEKMNFYGIGISPSKNLKKKRVAILIVPLSENEDLLKRKIILEYGDATKPRGDGVKIIAQVVNTSGALGTGFGKSLAKNYPLVKEKLEIWKGDRNSFRLGRCQLIEVRKDLLIFQMLAQKGLYPSANEIPLKYEALRKCLSELYSIANSRGAKVFMPLIGAGQAKGNWEIISGMIHDELVSKGVEVNIYLLPGTVYSSKMKSNLTLFKEESTWRQEKLF